MRAALVLCWALSLAWGTACGAAEAQETSGPAEGVACQTFIQDALRQDPEFTRTLQVYLQATYQALSARSLAAWTLAASAGPVHLESISGNAFEPRTIDALSYELSVQKLFLATGTRLTLKHGNSLSRLDYDQAALAGFSDLLGVAGETAEPTYTVSLFQPLLKNAFGLGERYALESADLQAEAARLDAQEAWENKLAELFTAYLDWAAAHENLSALRDIMAKMEQLEEQVRRKVRAGVAEESDLLRTRENVLRIQAQLEQAEGEFDHQRRRTAYLRAGGVVPESDLGPAVPELEGFLQNCRPELLALPADAGVEDLRLVRKLGLLRQQQVLRERQADNAQWPSLDLVAEATFKGRSEDLGEPLPQTPRKDYRALVQASYPLGAAQAEGDLGRARAGLEELDASLRSTRRTLALGLKQAAETLTRLQRVLALQTEQEASAARKLALDERNYRIGRLDTFYLIDSQNALTNARLQRVQTQIRFNSLKVQFLSQTDRLLDQFPDLQARLR